jgi:hypothetical protein
MNDMYRYLSAIAVLVGFLPALPLRAEEKPEPVVQRIESPKGTFLFEQRYDRANHVWIVSIVSAKDSAVHEPFPGFGSAPIGISFALISPDENWIFFHQHYGSHAGANFLYRHKEGLKFEPVFKESFDGEAWKFSRRVEGVPRKKNFIVGEVEFQEWSPDSGRLLFQLYGNLDGTLEDRVNEAKEHKKSGVSGWWAYYNTKAGKFELTDKLRAANKGARKRWTFYESKESQSFLAPEAESIGHEGPDRPAAERLKEYQEALTALIEQRKTQLDPETRRLWFERNDNWRNRTEEQMAEFKDPEDQARAAATIFGYLTELREQWLPVYEPPKGE